TTPDRAPGAGSTAASTPQTIAVPSAPQAAPQLTAQAGIKTGRVGWRNFLAGGAIAATLLCAAGVGFYGWNHYRSQTAAAPKGSTGLEDQRPPVPGKTVSLGPLTGHLKLRFIDNPPPGSGKAKVSGPREGATSPLFNGQKVQLHVTLNRPAHVYLF